VSGLGNVCRDDTGMVGKLIVGWLIAIGLFGLVGIDTASIMFTKFQLADTASIAASTAANTYRGNDSTVEACQAAATSIAEDDADAKLAKQGCVVNVQTGEVTITLRKRASTILAGKFGFTKPYTHVTASDTAGPPL
jgi:uncharacterized membrane protein